MPRGKRETLFWPVSLAAAILVPGICLAVGCIKGPMWRTGYLSPWAQQRWAEEEQIAPTLMTKRKDLDAMVRIANAGSDAERKRAAEELAHVAQNDPVLLVRIEAVRKLGELNVPAAHAALAIAGKDPQSDVRMAAVHACALGKRLENIPLLQEILGGDSDIDIRLAAARALQDFRQPEAIAALGIAIDDPNPALQLRAMDSLRAVSGKDFGHDLAAWREYVKSQAKGETIAHTTATTPEAVSPSQVIR